MDGGILNHLLKCSANAAAENDDEQEKIIIRVFGNLPVHRESEVHLMKMLSEQGVIPPLFCR